MTNMPDTDDPIIPTTVDKGMAISSVGDMNRMLAKKITSMHMLYACGSGGSVNAEIAFVGEAPGEREVQVKAPLIGNSGKLLWECLRAEGITRGECYSTNLVKRPLEILHKSMKKPRAPIAKGELENWKHILLDELRRLPNVKYIVALGASVLYALTGNTHIDRWRGSVIPIQLGSPDSALKLRTVQVLCTYNPAHTFSAPLTEITLRMDLSKLHKLRNGTFSTPPITHLINPSYLDALDYIRMLQMDRKPVCYDIETINGETACIGLTNKTNEGMCIPFRSSAEHFYTRPQEINLRLALNALLMDKGMRFVAQNHTFDSTWLGFKDRIMVHGCWLDTMLAHHLLYPQLPHNLGYLVSQYTDYPFHKDDASDWRDMNDIDMLWRYNVKDVACTLLIAEKILDELREAKLDRFYFSHVAQLQPKLVRMTIGGVRADTRLKQQFTDEFGAAVTLARGVVESTARIAAGDDTLSINPNSPKQLGTLFFHTLKLVGRGTSTDAENRSRIRDNPRTNQDARDLLDALDDYAKKAKFFSTYANSRLDYDGRFRCEYKQTGVQSAPGRLSSSGTMWGNGLNLQNIPPRGRPMFIADEGYVFSYFDMAQIEARYVAWLANIVSWKHQFELARTSGGTYDAHRALASELFGIPYDDVPVEDFIEGHYTKRYIAKRCRHGLNYRMEAARLATTAGLPLLEASKAYALYHKLLPELRVWWNATIQAATRDRVLYSPLGRRWVLLERLQEDTLDSIIAFKPQSTAGDHVARVIYQCENDPRWPVDARFVLNIHDADIAMHRPEDGEVVRGLMKLYAEQSVFINDEPVICPADFALSIPDEQGVHRWSTLKKLKGVEALKPL